jgi:hypothetical protein
VARGTPRGAAVCVLRVETLGDDRLLITLTSTLDLNLSSQRHTQSVTTGDEALALVADFLREYEAGENFTAGS